MLPDRLVTMANQIGRFFASQGSEDRAVDGIADHLTKFWDPRMRRAILELAPDQAARLDPLPARAVQELARKRPPG